MSEEYRVPDGTDWMGCFIVGLVMVSVGILVAAALVLVGLFA